MTGVQTCALPILIVAVLEDVNVTEAVSVCCRSCLRSLLQLARSSLTLSGCPTHYLSPSASLMVTRLLHVLVTLPVALDVFVSLLVTVTDDVAVPGAALLGLMHDVSVAVGVTDVEALAELLSDMLFVSEPVADDDDVTACVSGPAAVKLVSLVLFENS